MPSMSNIKPRINLEKFKIVRFLKEIYLMRVLDKSPLSPLFETVKKLKILMIDKQGIRIVKIEVYFFCILTILISCLSILRIFNFFTVSLRALRLIILSNLTTDPIGSNRSHFHRVVFAQSADDD